MPYRRNFHPRILSLARLGLLGLALPCVYFGGAGAAFFYRQHADSRREHPRLAPVPAPRADTRLLVFAPHCDDETLGCAGLMQRTLSAGGQVRAVMLTNGDGFRAAVQRYVRDLRVTPEDYIKFAAHRQGEAVSALAHLGLKRSDVTFLGYPDRGLMPLWNAHWSPEAPYASAYTRRDRSPYPNTFRPASSYCGQHLLGDIKATLRRFRPTLVTVTHPSDDHPDHAAAAAFVARALDELRRDPAEAWAKSARLSYYLVHRGDWPLPQGSHPDSPLEPPAVMARTDTRWSSLPLSAAQTARKAESIARYPSQTAVMSRYLNSFARRTELLGDLAPVRVPTVAPGSLRIDGDSLDWERLPALALDPVRDNVLRDLQGGGDLSALYACRDAENLYVRLDTRQPLSRRVAYTLRLRAFGVGGATGPEALTLTLRPAAKSGPGVETAFRGRTLECAVPWSALRAGLRGQPPATLAVSAHTALAGVDVDQSGVRFLEL